MTKIPVVVVDDDKVDRYVVKRRLAKADDFAEIIEVETGDEFLEKFVDGHSIEPDIDLPLLVLMDVNLPGKNGFETILEMQERMKSSNRSNSVVVLMFTSSDNPADREQAEALEAVKGYITKPLNSNDVATILEFYRS